MTEALALRPLVCERERCRWLDAGGARRKRYAGMPVSIIYVSFGLLEVVT